MSLDLGLEVLKCSNEGFWSNLVTSFKLPPEDSQKLCTIFEKTASAVGKLDDQKISKFFNENVPNSVNNVNIAKDLLRKLPAIYKDLKSFYDKFMQHIGGNQEDADEAIQYAIEKVHTKQLEDYAEQVRKTPKAKTLKAAGYTKETLVNNLKLAASYVKLIDIKFAQSVSEIGDDLPIMYWIGHVYYQFFYVSKVLSNLYGEQINPAQ